MEVTPQKRPSMSLQSMQCKRGRWYSEKIEFSPPPKTTETEEGEEEAVLILKRFSKFPTLCFENVIVGDTKAVTLRVQNPLEKLQTVKIEKFPSEKGFSVETQNFKIDANSELDLKFSWSPVKAEGCRESVTFRTNSGCITQVFLLGTACAPPKKKKLQKRRSGSKFKPSVQQKHHTDFTYGPLSGAGKENVQFPNSFTSMADTKISNGAIPADTEGGKRFSFFLKPGEEVASSPIRRQTFLVSRMFKTASRSALQAISIPNESTPSSESQIVPTSSESNPYPSWAKQSGGVEDELPHKKSPGSASLEDSLSPKKIGEIETVSFEGKRIVNRTFENIPGETKPSRETFHVQDADEKPDVKLQDVDFFVPEQLLGETFAQRIETKNIPLKASKGLLSRLPASDIHSRPSFAATIARQSDQFWRTCKVDGTFNSVLKSSVSKGVRDRAANNMGSPIRVKNTRFHVDSKKQPLHGGFAAGLTREVKSCNKQQNPQSLEKCGNDILVQSTKVTSGQMIREDKWKTFEVNSSDAQFLANNIDKNVADHEEPYFVKEGCGTSANLDIGPSSEHKRTFEVKAASEKSDCCGSSDMKLENNKCLERPECHKNSKQSQCVVASPKKSEIPETLTYESGSDVAAKSSADSITKNISDDVFRESLFDQSVHSNENPDCVQRCSTGIRLNVPELIFPLDLSVKRDSAFSDERCCQCNSKVEEEEVKKISAKKQNSSKLLERRHSMKPPLRPTKSLSSDLKRSSSSRLSLAKLSTPSDLRKKTLKQNLFKAPSSVRAKRLSIPRDRKARYSSPKARVSVAKVEDKKVVKALSAKAKNAIVAPRSLNLIKREPSDKTRHPNPYAAKNMYYDERWMEKQEHSFTRWLNFILTPPDELKTTSDVVKVDAAKLWVESMKDIQRVRAPTKEDMSLKAYTATRRLNMLRRASCRLYQSEKLVAVIRKIEIEVDKKKLVIRKDRALHADYGIKKHILGLLMCYNPLWLRIGLETVYGEIIILQSNEDLHGLSRFIAQRFLSNPDIAAKFSHSKVPNFFRPGYEEALKEFTLKKFLLLVLFLDCAKTSRLIDHDPCLFRKNAEYKASRDLLLVFSREYLSGEGDITRHLKQLNYIVTHQQGILDEFDYSVTNIATDLRCGLRLSRVMELLLQNWTLCLSLRLPAISRLQKIHNNEVALKAFIGVGYTIDGDISARDIVDGHREKTLSLLWQIIFKSQISKLLNMKLLKNEIAYLQRSLRHRADVAAFNAIRMPLLSSGSCRSDFVSSDLYEENECVRLLLFWCQAVCGHYGLKIHNFTTSFSDGKALCFLLHHYHPQILPFADICQKTTISCFEEQNLDSSKGGDDPDGDDDNIFNFRTGTTDSREMEQLLKNEKKNLQLAFEKFQELGGIPVLSRPTDMSNTIPDEKVVITLVSYLNMRLMDLSQEIRAARIVQLAWRKRQLEKQQERLMMEIAAAIVIQRAIRKFLERKRLQRREKAALILQTLWRVVKAKKVAASLRHEQHLKFLSRKAILIQAAYRGYRERKAMQKKIDSVILIQSIIRMWLRKSSYDKTKKATIKIQRWYRAVVLGRKLRSEYLLLKKATVCIQAHTRAMLAQKKFKMTKLMIVKIQASVRGYLVKSKYLKICDTVVYLQQRYRAKTMGRKCRQEYVKLRDSVMKIQKCFREYKKYQREGAAATKIQAFWRCHIVRQRYLKSYAATLYIQQKLRAFLLGKQQHRHFLETKKNAIMVQSCVRRYLARKKYVQVKRATIQIQSNVRCWKAMQKYNRCRSSVILIQRWWRACIMGRLQRQVFLDTRTKAITIQSMYRQHLARRDFLEKKLSAIVLQKNIRRFLAFKLYQNYRKSAITFQRKWRAILAGRQQRKDFVKTKQKVTFLQACVRCHIARKKYLIAKQSCVIIQKYTRQMLASRNFREKRSAIVNIQRWWRACLDSRKAKQRYVAMRSSMIIIQAWIRMIRARRHYLKLKWAVGVLEIRWPAQCKARDERKKYLTIKQATVTIQSAYKGYVCRTMFKKHRSAAIRIQSMTRAYLARKKFIRQKKAASTIQYHYRAFRKMRRQRDDYRNILKNVIMIQSYYRGYKDRKKLYLMHYYATMIRNQFLSYICRKKYVMIRQATINIQRRFRANVLMKKEREKYCHIKASTIVLQSAFRGYLARQTRQKIIAAIKLQSTFRMYKTKKNYRHYRQIVIHIQSTFRMLLVRQKYRKLRENVVFIQRRFRQYLLTKSLRKQYLQKIKACIVLQSAYRALLARREVERIRAAICIQSHIRSYCQRKRFLYIKHAATIIQASARMVIARKRYCRYLQTVLFVQDSYRRKRETRLIHEQFVITRKSCITIQSAFRGYSARCQFERIKAAVKLQSYFRGYKARAHYILTRRKIIMAQSVVRRFIACRNYHKSLALIIKLQRRFRESLLARKHRAEFVQKKMACVLLQSYFRTFLIRKAYLKAKSLIVHVQSVIRMKLQRRKYLKQRGTIIEIQRAYRNWVISRGVRQDFLQKRQAALILQSWYHTWKQRCWYMQTLQNIICIQTHARSFLVKKELEKKECCVVKIQRWWRDILDARKKRERLNSAAVLIQRTYKGYAQRKKCRKQLQFMIGLQSVVRGYFARRRFMIMKLEHSSAMVIQNAFRVCRATKELQRLKEERRKMLRRIAHVLFLNLMATRIQRWYRNILLKREAEEKLSSIILIQRWWRAVSQRLWFLKMQKNVYCFQMAARKRLFERNKAATVLQACIRSWLVRKDVNTKNAAALKLQALWKGYKVRCSIASESVNRAREKISLANSRASEEMKLSNRTSLGLDNLLKSRALTHVMNAVMNLDVATQFSPVCCERVVQAGGVQILIQLINSCNRSVPHMDIIRYSINILLNLAKYEKTVPYIWECSESLNTILEMMKIFREKGVPIFTKCCSLLWILSQDVSRAQEMRKRKSVIEQIMSFHYLVMRKKKMEDKRLQTKAKMIDLNSSSFLSSSIMQSPRPSKKSLLIQPDWMLGREVMREFKDPVDAICALMKSLQLKSK